MVDAGMRKSELGERRPWRPLGHDDRSGWGKGTSAVDPITRSVLATQTQRRVIAAVQQRAGNRAVGGLLSRSGALGTTSTNEAIVGPGEQHGRSVEVGVPLTESPSDPAVDVLGLAESAKKGALELKRKHPNIVFTSGRRTVEDQARAMAQNVVGIGGRDWIEKVYKATTAGSAYRVLVTRLQDWVTDHPEATTVGAVAAGLRAILMTAPHPGVISRHLSGKAFDVKPPISDALYADAMRLPGVQAGVGKVKRHENGVEVLHVPFE